MALTGTHRYVDTSATYNGDGTSPEQATSDGGTGAYNSIQSALSAAPNNPSSESDRWLIWVRRLDSGSNISITSTLSPANDGGYNAPHMLIGWPFREQKTGMSVDSVPTGTDNLGFNNAQWQFIDSALTEGDNYWLDAVVEFTSGSNSGLSRRVIWFDATNDKVYLDFPLPNNISAGDQYTITLETKYYDDRPQAGIDEGWDSDTNVMPTIDSGGGSFSTFNFDYDYHWYVSNFEIQNNGGSSYAAFRAPAEKHEVLKIHDVGIGIWANNSFWITTNDRVYIWNIKSSYGGFYYAFKSILKNCHVLQPHPDYTSSYGIRGSFARLKDCTFGRISQLNTFIYTSGETYRKSLGENVLIDCISYINKVSDNWSVWKNEGFYIGGWNGDKEKFKSFHDAGDIYNIDEDGTIDPPSGSATYIKLKPSTYCNSHRQLVHEEQRYQSSGSKTYTWKFYPTGWSSLSTSDIEVEAWYLDESSGAHRAYTTANPSSVTNDTWNDLSITVNPAQAGTVYFKIKLKKYESMSAYIALDPKVDVS